MSQIRIFLNSLENESKEFPSFKVKVRYLEDYMNKLCVQTFNQRHSSQKEPLELCLMFLGKLISILTNKINKQALQKI